MTNSQGLLEPGFLFSQHSLNTYAQCPRRFLLRYVDRQPWPMLEGDEPLAYEEHLARGRVFHQWMVRAQLGVPMADITDACEDEHLVRWWRAAQRIDWRTVPGTIRLPELAVVVPVGDYRLYARYDLVAWSQAAGALILDWKTLPVRLSNEVLSRRVQTLVYLYTLVAGGSVAVGCPPLLPESVAMRYWFAEFPDATADLRYSDVQYAADQAFLTALVAQIAGQPRAAFLATTEQRLCARCNYRGYCHHQDVRAEADPAGWLDEDVDFALDVREAPELDF